MSRDKDLGTRTRMRPENFAPALFAPTAWDALLALFADQRDGMSLAGLAGMCSVPALRLTDHLAQLEDHDLVTGRSDPQTGEVLALLSVKGRGLMRRYLSATSELQLRSRE